MNGIAELIESELNTAILKQDKEAIKRFSLIVGQKIDKMDQIEDDNKDIKSDVKVIAEIVKQGFEDMDKRFSMMFKFMSLGFTVITIIIVVLKYLK